MSFEPTSLIVATLIATAGLWWFRLILSPIKKMPALTRTGIYALIWLAYFIIVLVIIKQTGA